MRRIRRWRVGGRTERREVEGGRRERREVERGREEGQREKGVGKIDVNH